MLNGSRPASEGAWQDIHQPPRHFLNEYGKVYWTETVRTLVGGSVHITPLNNGVHFVLCIGVNLIAFIACFSATVSPGSLFECQHLISFPGPQYGTGGLGMRPYNGSNMQPLFNGCLKGTFQLTRAHHCRHYYSHCGCYNPRWEVRRWTGPEHTTLRQERRLVSPCILELCH